MTKTWELGDPPDSRGLFMRTLAIVAITAFMAFGIPAVDRSIPAIGFEPGATQTIHEQVEFTPEPGWIGLLIKSENGGVPLCGAHPDASLLKQIANPRVGSPPVAKCAV